MGLTLALKSFPDLILLDAMMPEMDGQETNRRLMAEPRLQRIPVISLTALS
jgi:CheY-like chemotaxis protein